MKKIILFLFLLLLFILAYQMGLKDILSFDYLKMHLDELKMHFHSNPIISCLAYFFLYIFVTAVSFPGATILTLLAGAVMEFPIALLLTSFASTIGATLAFLGARFLFGDIIEEKFSSELEIVNDKFKSEGVSYLITLRLLPIFPFFLINILMGLTKIKIRKFFFASQLGMFPATIVFLFAGKSLSSISFISEILSPKIITAFFLLGLIPYISKYLLAKYNWYNLTKHFRKPKKFDYNMIVIGGGSAGLVTAFISSAVKAKVALIEKDRMGGECLNTGCIPSKALIKTTKVLGLAQKSQELGLKNIVIDFHFSDVMNRIRRKISEVAPHDSSKRYTELGVQCISGAAKVLSPFEISVNGKILTTQNITIASGASPLIPPIKGIGQIKYLTSNTLWNLDILPKNFLIIGGGPIGCEIAQAFNRLGSVVTLIEEGPHLLNKEDSEVNLLIENILKKEGVGVCLNSKVLEFKTSNTLIAEINGELLTHTFDQVLIAVGRKANTSDMGLEELKIKFRPNGMIETNEYLETNYQNIFACGDVTGPYQLTHMAAHQAWYCSVNGLFGFAKKYKVDYSTVPWATYTEPEVATVGMNEKALQDNKNHNYEVTLFPLAELDRSIVDSQTQGFVKVITKKGSDKILGATIVAPEASLMILEFISAMKFKKGLKDIMSTIHIYPTTGEANKYVAGLWRKNHTAEKTLNWLEIFFKWKRN